MDVMEEDEKDVIRRREKSKKMLTLFFRIAQITIVVLIVAVGLGIYYYTRYISEAI